MDANGNIFVTFSLPVAGDVDDAYCNFRDIMMVNSKDNGLNWENPVPEIGINLQTFFANSATPPAIQSLEFLAALVLQGLDLGIQHLSDTKVKKMLTGYNQLLTCMGKPAIVAHLLRFLPPVTKATFPRICLNLPDW